MYTHVEGHYVPRFFRLTKVPTECTYDCNCTDLYAFCALLPLTALVSYLLLPNSWVIASCVIVCSHTLYEVLYRVWFSTLCVFPLCFSWIYVTCCAFLAVTTCVHFKALGSLQVFVSIALCIRYAWLNHLNCDVPQSYTP